jgi:hypothetical protein
MGGIFFVWWGEDLKILGLENGDTIPDVEKYFEE